LCVESSIRFAAWFVICKHVLDLTFQNQAKCLK
jgi:hypothetical protein